MVYLLELVIFYSYVKLPEGSDDSSNQKHVASISPYHTPWSLDYNDLPITSNKGHDEANHKSQLPMGGEIRDKIQQRKSGIIYFYIAILTILNHH
jgi:hypothetical protein